MRTLFSVLLLIVTLNAGSAEFAKEMGYETDYKKAIAKAKKEEKLVMLVVGTRTCPWCRKLEKQTLKKEEVHSKVMESFIPVALYKDGDYPSKFIPRAVPTVYFIDPSDETALLTSMGYKNKKMFLATLEDAE